MKLGKKTLIGIVLLIAGGVAAGSYAQHASKCFAAGGGAEFLPPASMSKNRPLTLELTLTTWGENSCINEKYWQGDVPRDIFTDVQCHYRVQGAPQFTDAKMELIRDEATPSSYRALYRCTVPAQSSGTELEYYFDYRWPDQVHTLQQKPIPIK